MIPLPPAGTPDVEFELRHPDDPTQTARVGHDPAHSLYVEVEWNGVLVALDAADMDADDDPVIEVIALLINFGFLPPGTLGELRRWRDTPSCWRGRRAPRAVRRVLRVVRALEACSS